jgi:hypothetical protein
LYRELTAATFPLRKEELIERVWGLAYDPRWDSRFYKLVERAKKAGMAIVCSHHAYFLNPNK